MRPPPPTAGIGTPVRFVPARAVRRPGPRGWAARWRRCMPTTGAPAYTCKFLYLCDRLLLLRLPSQLRVPRRRGGTFIRSRPGYPPSVSWPKEPGPTRPRVGVIGRWARPRGNPVPSLAPPPPRDHAGSALRRPTCWPCHDVDHVARLLRKGAAPRRPTHWSWLVKTWLCYRASTICPGAGRGLAKKLARRG